MESVMNSFPIGHEEYEELERKFGRLCHKAAWVFLEKNYNNNHIEEQVDIVQTLRIAVMRAGSYTKRQRYIENCFEALDKHAKDKFVRKLLNELRRLWRNRRRHGANRQKYGPFQEVILERLVQKYVPKAERPDRNARLEIDIFFARYCKQIIWNSVKSLGKKVTREKSYRTGMVSLSEFAYLAV